MSKIVLKTSSLFFALVLVACFLGCDFRETSGTVTDTGNTIAGVVHRADGSVAADAIVRMARMRVKDGVGMPEQREVLTDSTGAFEIDSAYQDTFQLAVIDPSVAEIFYLSRTTQKSSKEYEKITLSKAAVFKSSLVYEDVAEPAVQVGSHFMVYVEGTPFHQSVFAGDTFEILIPPGDDWWMDVFPGDPQIVAKLQESGVADSAIYRAWNMGSKLNAGDTLNVGPFLWSTTTSIDSLIKEAEVSSRISGTVLCRSGRPCDNVEVSLITDLYGFKFDGDSLEFKVSTVTDSVGNWWLPVPAEVPDDSFRVEYRLLSSDGDVAQAGTSRYVKASEVENLEDTLFLGRDTLARTSGLMSGVSLVVDKDDSTQSSDCMMNSVVVGIKGTSHFIREVTCNLLEIKDIPAGNQEIVLYSGDPKIISVLKKNEVPMMYYVSETNVSLPEQATQQVQWMTYSPPTEKYFPRPLAETK